MPVFLYQSNTERNKIIPLKYCLILFPTLPITVHWPEYFPHLMNKIIDKLVIRFLPGNAFSISNLLWILIFPIPFSSKKGLLKTLEKVSQLPEVN